MAHQDRYILTTIAERRHRQRENVQAIIQIASELPVFHHLLQVPMSGRDHPNIHMLCTGAAWSFKFMFLQHPQQFRLELE